MPFSILRACSWLAVVLLCATAKVESAWARDVPPPTEKTLSPYFFVEGGDPGVDRLPLISTEVDASVSGVIADVKVTQHYKNDGRRPINARYVFPASTRAAVHGLSMRLGNRLITAEIRERRQAEREFEQAKSEGKTATLLEQQRPNVFSMSVANVLPGDRIAVTLEYTELLVPSEGVYEFVYPTVVGPRYSNQTESGAPARDLWVKSPYLRQGKAPTHSFDLRARVATALPLAGLQVQTHKVSTKFSGKQVADVALDASERLADSRDFILRYRLAGEAVQTGVSLYESGNEKFFLALIEPPKRVAPEAIPPREYVFVVDVSGSMHGFPLDTAKALLRSLVGALRPTDSFNVLFFSGGSALLAPQSLPANAANIQRALTLLNTLDGNGGTELLSALDRALSLSSEPGLSRNFVVITDGYISAEKAVFDKIRSNLGRANVFAFGIGAGVNRYLIEGIAKAGLGEPFVVTEPAESAAQARRFQKYVEAPVLTNVRVDFDGFDAHAVEPQAIPDVLAERPIVIHGKWRGKAAGKLVLSGIGGMGKYNKTVDLSQVTPSKDQRALPYLWARTRISNLTDFAFGRVGEAEQAEVTRLGLGYGLLTPYTSFIAVSKQVRTNGAPAQDVDQPLPLPAGVSESAVGGGLMGADEPELVLLLGLLLIGMLALCVKRHASRVLA